MSAPHRFCSGFWYNAVPAEAACLLTMRRELDRWLRMSGVDGVSWDDVVLATYEALANVVEHAYAGAPQGTFDFAARFDARSGDATVTVTDAGTWRAHRIAPERGRGMRLMRALANDVEFAQGPEGTTVTLHWKS